MQVMIFITQKGLSEIAKIIFYIFVSALKLKVIKPELDFGLHSELDSGLDE